VTKTMFDFLKKKKSREARIQFQVEAMKHPAQSSAGYIEDALKETVRLYLMAIYSQNTDLLPGKKMSPNLYQLATDSILKDRERCSRTCETVSILNFRHSLAGRPDIGKKVYVHYDVSYEVEGTFNKKDREDRDRTIFIFRLDERLGWVLHDIERWGV